MDTLSACLHTVTNPTLNGHTGEVQAMCVLSREYNGWAEGWGNAIWGAVAMLHNGVW